LQKFYKKYHGPLERIKIIKHIISNDPKYHELKKYNGLNQLIKIFTFHDIAVCANSFMEFYADYDIQRPITTKFGESAFFQSDKRQIKREGAKNAGAKYAVHFVTATNQKTNGRHYDTSKAITFGLIKDGLENANYKWEGVNRKGIYTINYYYKYSESDFMEIICVPYPDKENYIRVIAFAPNKDDKFVFKKTIPAQSGDKSHD
jgi:hypothetical protein